MTAGAPTALDHVPPHVVTPDLADLVRLSATGDETAFRTLYELTAPVVYGIVVRVLRDAAQASEVVQEVYVEVWATAGRYEAGRAPVRAWLATLAHRRAVDRVRSASAARTRDGVYGAEQAQESPDASTQALANAEAADLRRALGCLTTGQREAIELAYFGGRTHVQVASYLQIPVGTAKTRIRDGLLRLRDHLTERPGAE